MVPQNNVKMPKRNPRDHPSIEITSRLLPKYAEDYVAEIKDVYQIGVISDVVLNIILQFLQSCKKENAREAILDLMAKTIRFINKDVDNIVEHFILAYQKFLEGKDETFVKDVFAGRVSNAVWKNSIIDAVRQDVSKYYYILDQLFHLYKFENDKKNPYFFVRRMLYNDETRNNALDWIQIFNLDLTQFIEAKSKNTVSNTANNSPWMELVEETASELSNLYSNGNLSGFSIIIDNFFKECQKQWFRSATMELVHLSNMYLSDVEDCDPSVIIFQIFIRFYAYMEYKSPEFSQEVLSVKVSDDLWNKSFKVAIEQKRVECYPALDLLYKIHQPETTKRSELIHENIGKLISHEETLNNGIEKVLSFGIDLEKLKINSNDDIITEAKSWLNTTEEVLHEIQRLDYDREKSIYALELFFISRIDKRREKLDKHFQELYRTNGLKISVTPCPLDQLRPATMELITRIDSTKEISSELIFQIYFKFAFGSRNTFNQVIVDVSDELWTKAWKICFENAFSRDLKECRTSLELLFRIQKPETEHRRSIIYDCIREKVSKNETFHKAIEWISNFNLKSLKEEIFGHVVIYSLIFEKGKDTIFSNFPSREDKIYFFHTADELLYQMKTGAIPTCLKNANLTVEKLLHHVKKLAETLNIKLERGNYYAHKEMYIQTTQIKFEYMDRFYFELYILEDLKNRRHDKYKRWFIQSILNDKKYAYCWAKYLEIPEHHMPKELKTCSIANINVQGFIEEINQRIHYPVDKDNYEKCVFWEKSYDLHTVLTRKALKKFLKKFLKSKPKVIGVDIESGKLHEAAVLQIATFEKLYLIDIQELSRVLSKNEVTKFFELIFDPSVIRVGYAFKNDFEFLYKKFYFLEEMLEEETRKVFCLEKLLKFLLEEKEILAKTKMLCNELSEDELSLAKVANAILNIVLDKSEQLSDWTKRPLTQFQKIYAVLDALVVVLIINAIEDCLKKHYSLEEVDQIMQNGYMYYKDVKIRRNLLIFNRWLLEFANYEF